MVVCRNLASWGRVAFGHTSRGWFAGYGGMVWWIVAIPGLLLLLSLVMWI